MRLELTASNSRLNQALALAPKALERHMDDAIDVITQMMARDARIKAPKAFSTLTDSIRRTRPSRYEGIIAPAVNYARMVEEGTKGAGDRLPPHASILDWIKVKHITPRDPEMTEDQLAHVIARSIAIKGTPAQPYLAPAFEDNKASAARRIDAAIDAALREVSA